LEGVYVERHYWIQPSSWSGRNDLEKVNASLIASTLYADSTATNGSTYYYAATAVNFTVMKVARQLRSKLLFRNLLGSEDDATAVLHYGCHGHSG
jgi:Tfp pilus assembly protein PilV